MNEPMLTIATLAGHSGLLAARCRPGALDWTRTSTRRTFGDCIAWDSIATASLLPFHRCMSEAGANRALANPWFSSISVASGRLKPCAETAPFVKEQLSRRGLRLVALSQRLITFGVGNCQGRSKPDPPAGGAVSVAADRHLARRPPRGPRARQQRG